MRSNTNIFLAAFLVLLTSAAPSFAAGPYVSALAGLNINHDGIVETPGAAGSTASYKPGAAFNVSIGSNVASWRIEGEFGLKRAQEKTIGAMNVLSHLVNLYYDYNPQAQFFPYVGAGCGLLVAESNADHTNSHDAEFGYQLIAGAGYNLNRNVTLDLSYRFLGAANTFGIEGNRISYTSSNIMGGIRLNY